MIDCRRDRTVAENGENVDGSPPARQEASLARRPNDRDSVVKELDEWRPH
jgi:hypothetical protein